MHRGPEWAFLSPVEWPSFLFLYWRRRLHPRNIQHIAAILAVTGISSIDAATHQTQRRFKTFVSNPSQSLTSRRPHQTSKPTGPNSATSMRIQRSCYCYGDALDPYLLCVRNGITTSVTNELTGELMNLDDYRYRLPTITDLFDIIDTACTKPYANLFVTYDADGGYPTSVGYDKNECIADEENSYTVTNFVDMSQMFVDASTNLRWRRRRYHQG